MKFNHLLAIAGLVICVLVDLYIYKAIKHRVQHRKTILTRLHLISATIGYACLFTAIALPRQSGDNDVLITDMWLIFIFMSMLLCKLLFCIFDWISHLPRLLHRNRWKFLSAAGVAISVLLFGAMWWGALVNRNRVSVTETVIDSPRWPDAFDGYKIAQISDLHVGSWGTDTTFLSKLVDNINALGPDLIVFTGDIVNRQSDEFTPMVSTFSRLKATDGVLAIMGNHDYGDYRSWPDETAHIADRENLHNLYNQTGHRLLLNETQFIKRGSDSIAVIGVENIGEPPFSIYGDLDASYPDTSDSLPKILLTHNPAHWSADIKNNPLRNIDLTLSGHTHAMQVQICGFTPSSFRYSTPWGLYTDSIGHSLVVNRGAGTVGMPMRLGATPEITLITLRSRKQN